MAIASSILLLRGGRTSGKGRKLRFSTDPIVPCFNVTGTRHPHCASQVSDAQAACMQNPGRFPRSMPRGLRRQGGDPLRRPLSHRLGRGRGQGITSRPWRGAVRREHRPRPQGPLHLLQLLRLLPLLRWPRRGDARRLGGGQQRMAVGLRHLHLNHTPLRPRLPRRLRHVQKQDTDSKSCHNHRQGGVTQTCTSCNELGFY